MADSFTDNSLTQAWSNEPAKQLPSQPPVLKRMTREISHHVRTFPHIVDAALYVRHPFAASSVKKAARELAGGMAQ
jgi:hypothetical protein